KSLSNIQGENAKVNHINRDKSGGKKMLKGKGGKEGEMSLPVWRALYHQRKMARGRCASTTTSNERNVVINLSFIINISSCKVFTPPSRTL
ncbi:hypothetical protein J6590_103708, partial [Homalodisca vitripennis]